MKFPVFLPVFGDPSFRGACPVETAEQITFFQWLQAQHPRLHRIAIHPKNEGSRTYQQARAQKIEGSLNKGASDIIIPSFVPFICEMKRKDHTKSRWEDGQLEYLESAQDAGAFVCVALGYEGAISAIHEWLSIQNTMSNNTGNK